MSRSRTAPEVEEEQAPASESLPTSTEAIDQLRLAILGGQPWFEALVDAVGRWRLPEESIGDRHYRYLLGGEAFDWLLLAERLLDEVADLVPAREVDALLFDGHWPQDMDDEEFQQRLGAAKHSAHLNYLYGVLVEEALQLFVESEIQKETWSRVWGQDSREDLGMYQRIYGKDREELKAAHYEDTGTLLGSSITYAERQDFIYWLFKYRLKQQDPARIASDTRKGLAQLSRMELSVNERRRGASLDETAFAERYQSAAPSRAS